MSYEEQVNDEYFRYLCELIDVTRFARQNSYRNLLMHLHNIEFTWFVPNDDNRADDGIQVRRRFALSRNDIGLQRYLNGPCSVLEMMVGLALRCEEWMDNTDFGNRTGQWFWGMINNVGLSSMRDSKFDREYVDDVIARLLNRQYEPNGKGGLFTVKHCNHDLRTVEIWCQLSWYLNSIM